MTSCRSAVGDGDAVFVILVSPLYSNFFVFHERKKNYNSFFYIFSHRFVSDINNKADNEVMQLWHYVISVNCLMRFPPILSLSLFFPPPLSLSLCSLLLSYLPAVLLFPVTFFISLWNSLLSLHILYNRRTVRGLCDVYTTHVVLKTTHKYIELLFFSIISTVCQYESHRIHVDGFTFLSLWMATFSSLHSIRTFCLLLHSYRWLHSMPYVCRIRCILTRTQMMKNINQYSFRS